MGSQDGDPHSNNKNIFFWKLVGFLYFFISSVIFVIKAIISFKEDTNWFIISIFVVAICLLYSTYFFKNLLALRKNNHSKNNGDKSRNKKSVFPSLEVDRK